MIGRVVNFMKRFLADKITAAFNTEYEMCYWREYDYKKLQCVAWIMRAGSKDHRTINDVIIMADTETSKTHPGICCENYVVAWTISLRAYGRNLCTLYGHRPDTIVQCFEKLHDSMAGDRTFIYFHNLSYDWVFIRRFMIESFGIPEKQLNIKPHYPLFIEFTNGIMIKDSLMLSQRGLERWAKDLNVPHQKAVGMWDYEKIRTQNEDFTPDELKYIENDTLAGVECIDATRKALKKHIYSIPYTATGIPREEIRKIGSKNRGRNLFERLVPTWDQQLKLEKVFHGGFTHANRHLIGEVITMLEDGMVQCYDFASSYPYSMLVEKYPMENFHPYKPCTLPEVVSLSGDYAVMCKVILVKPRLKDDFQPMPVLQYSKATVVNPVLDNGRILCAAYCEIYLSEQDIKVIEQQYDYDEGYCVEVEVAHKDYLPKWFRDYIFSLFEEKTKLKGKDPVLYALAKARLNSCYGMCVQKPVKEVIEEDYITGDYNVNETDLKKAYQAYKDNKRSILPYQWGVWCTAYAMEHLFKLGDCVSKNGTWIYSDTDSCYAVGWDQEKVTAYNEMCKEKLKAAGYGAVLHNDREYWLGVAESEGEADMYTEFVTLGAKRYCGRNKKDGELHITVAGVPKVGAKCLKDDINNFKKGLIFPGTETGKQMHTYFFEEIHTTDNGLILADSVDLSPCDYLLDDVNVPDWESIFRDEIDVPYAEGVLD
jgi:hypothetical protein